MRTHACTRTRTDVRYKVTSMADIHALPKTKWNVAQPEDVDARENAMDGGVGG